MPCNTKVCGTITTYQPKEATKYKSRENELTKLLSSQKRDNTHQYIGNNQVLIILRVIHLRKGSYHYRLFSITVIVFPQIS